MTRLSTEMKEALGIPAYNYEITIDTDALRALLGRARSNTTGKAKGGPIRVKVLTDSTDFVVYYAPDGPMQDEHGVKPVQFDVRAHSFEAADKMAWKGLCRYFKRSRVPGYDRIHTFKRIPGNPHLLRNKYGAAPYDLEALEGFDFEDITNA